MALSFRFAARPGYLVAHVFVLVLAVTMIFLGRWQLHVSESKGLSLQNFGYAIQWWLFSIFGVVMWFKILRDTARRAQLAEAPPEPAAPANHGVTYRRYVMPTAEQAPADSVQAQYNDYLAALAADDARDAER